MNDLLVVENNVFTNKFQSGFRRGTGNNDPVVGLEN